MRTLVFVEVKAFINPAWLVELEADAIATHMGQEARRR